MSRVAELEPAGQADQSGAILGFLRFGRFWEFRECSGRSLKFFSVQALAFRDCRLPVVKRLCLTVDPKIS